MIYSLIQEERKESASILLVVSGALPFGSEEKNTHTCYGKHSSVTSRSGVFHLYLSVYSRKLYNVHLGSNLCSGKSLFALRGTYLI